MTRVSHNELGYSALERLVREVIATGQTSRLLGPQLSICVNPRTSGQGHQSPDGSTMTGTAADTEPDSTVQLVRDKVSRGVPTQGVLFVGESGSGKSFQTRRFLTGMLQHNNRMSRTIMRALAVLDVLGERATENNDRSSRCAKHITLQIGVEGMTVNSLEIETAFWDLSDVHARRHPGRFGALELLAASKRPNKVPAPASAAASAANHSEEWNVFYSNLSDLVGAEVASTIRTKLERVLLLSDAVPSDSAWSGGKVRLSQSAVQWLDAEVADDTPVDVKVNSLSATLYHSIIETVVKAINAKLNVVGTQGVANASASPAPVATVHVIDIPGFENLSSNGLFQLYYNSITETTIFQFQTILQNLRQANQSAGAGEANAHARPQPTLAKAGSVIKALELCTETYGRAHLVPLLQKQAMIEDQGGQGRNVVLDHPCGKVHYAIESFFDENLAGVVDPALFSEGGTGTAQSQGKTDTISRQAASIKDFKAVLKACLADTLFVINVRACQPGKSEIDAAGIQRQLLAYDVAEAWQLMENPVMLFSAAQLKDTFPSLWRKVGTALGGGTDDDLNTMAASLLIRNDECSADKVANWSIGSDDGLFEVRKSLLSKLRDAELYAEDKAQRNIREAERLASQTHVSPAPPSAIGAKWMDGLGNGNGPAQRMARDKRKLETSVQNAELEIKKHKAGEQADKAEIADLRQKLSRAQQTTGMYGTEINATRAVLEHYKAAMTDCTLAAVRAVALLGPDGFVGSDRIDGCVRTIQDACKFLPADEVDALATAIAGCMQRCRDEHDFLVGAVPMLHLMQAFARSHADDTHGMPQPLINLTVGASAGATDTLAASFRSVFSTSLVAQFKIRIQSKPDSINAIEVHARLMHVVNAVRGLDDWAGLLREPLTACVRSLVDKHMVLVHLNISELKEYLTELWDQLDVPEIEDWLKFIW